MKRADEHPKFKNFNLVFEDHTNSDEMFTRSLDSLMAKYPNARLVAVWRIEGGKYRLFFSEEL